MDYIQAAKNLGFADAVIVSTNLIACDEDIRALCVPDKCGNYGSGWICPPGCGSIEACRDVVAGYKSAIILQSVRENVDMSSGEEMLKITKEHNAMAMKLFKKIREEQGNAYLLTTGGCDLCEKCTFPDEPCRIPDKSRGSLSAFGINVSKLCEKAGMEFSFTPGILRMMACVLY
ncbi:MAG: DUF2284 domain-containing protein [Clostridiales bacterium]|nr:DUF2284 domain-containing protein [Clostridiales bacterium]